METIKFYLFIIKTFELIIGVIIDSCDLITNYSLYPAYYTILLLTCILIRIILIALNAIIIFKE